VQDSCGRDSGHVREIGRRVGGTSFALSEGAMSEISLPPTYNEPTVMWRMRRSDGRHAQAVIDPTSRGARVVWFLNGNPLGVRCFDDWRGAVEWADRLRKHYWSVGWRLSDEVA